jgi:hypothetical protein
MRSPLAAIPIPLLLLLTTTCDHASDPARRQRLLALIDTLPRLEAEERAWPRSPSLACDERAATRVHEIDLLRADLDELSAALPSRPELTPIFAACSELQGCARCDEGFAAHCARARELLVDVQIALSRTDLR